MSPTTGNRHADGQATRGGPLSTPEHAHTDSPGPRCEKKPMTHHLHFFWSRLERLAGAILQAVAGPARGASARRRDGRSPLRDRLDVAAASGRLSPELRRLISEPATDLELAHQLLDDLGIPRRVPAAAAITVYTSTPGDHRA